MKLRLVLTALTALAVLAATIVPTAASASGPPDPSRGTFLSLPPDLHTGYLEAHHPHRDPVHPNAKYRHRKLRTADAHRVERYNGQVETIPAGQLCDFDVNIQSWGTRPVWEWTNREGEIVHEVANPKLVDRFSANGRAFWSIDEGWDYAWTNRDGTTFVEGTGTHLWIHDKHRKFRQYGTWHLLFGPEGLLYEKYFRDKRSVWDGTFDEGGATICRFLAPR
jgi:hypothetical protein